MHHTGVISSQRPTVQIQEPHNGGERWGLKLCNLAWLQMTAPVANFPLMNTSMLAHAIYVFSETAIAPLQHCICTVLIILVEYTVKFCKTNYMEEDIAAYMNYYLLYAL